MGSPGAHFGSKLGSTKGLKMFSRPPDHHIEISGGPTEVLVDWGHRTTLISSPGHDWHFILWCL